MALTSKWLLQPIAIGLCLSIAQAQPQAAPARLDVTVVQGEGAVNRIRRRADTPPVVRIEDGEHRPVAGAVVMFTLPTEGATGDFGGQKTAVVTTGADGVATIKAMRLNAVPGKVPINVGASYRGLTARTIITQTTIVPQGEKAGKATTSSGGHGALIAVLVGIAAVGAGGAAYAVSQKKQSSPGASTPTAGPTPIGVSAGTGSIAGGH